MGKQRDSNIKNDKMYRRRQPLRRLFSTRGLRAKTGVGSNGMMTVTLMTILTSAAVAIITSTLLTMTAMITTTIHGVSLMGVYGQEQEVDDGDAVCHGGGGGGNIMDGERSCLHLDAPESYCDLGTNSGDTPMAQTDIYRYGGSAQAYRPGSSMSSVVCDPDVAKATKYKASSWPFTRRTTKRGSAPTIHIQLTIWTCYSTNERSSESGGCSCHPLQIHDSVNHDGLRVEVWQTRPDGTYSTLRTKSAAYSSFSDDECRANVPVEPGAAIATASFSTVAPGSTGIMGGLGPWNWESYPYGRPVIHMLLTSPSHYPLLLDVPILFRHKTLEQRKFSLMSMDWSGHAWSVPTPPEDILPYNITSWTPDVNKNHIDIGIDIYLQNKQSSKTQKDAMSSSTLSAADLFCPSSIISFSPSSFFVEPIAVCRRHLLDFFPL